MAYYDLKRTGTQYMFNLKGDNHETVLTSERYVAKQGALGGIAAVKANSPYDARYRRLNASNGAAYFTLHAQNGETVGTSELYSSASARDGGIEWVKRNAPGAAIKDNT